MNVKRIFYRSINPVRKIYWFLFRPQTFGVKCLVEHDGQFLMIRNTYGKMHWTFPGGKMKRREKPEDTVCREIFEEVGINTPEPVPLGSYFSTKEHKRDTVYCFYSRVASDAFRSDPVEILEAAWFAADNLPSPLSPAVSKVLELYRKQFGF